MAKKRKNKGRDATRAAGSRTAAASRKAAAGPVRRRTGPAIALAVVVVLVVVALVWRPAFMRRSAQGPTGPVGTGSARGFNVVLVTLDTVRRDRLGCYGYAAAETPTIDSLAQCGIQFDDAVATAPLTLPSHASMLTGLYPPRHGVRDNGLYHLDAEHTSLAETLKEHGYITAAFVSCFVLDERFGLGQGFDVYDFEVRELYPGNIEFNQRSANSVTDAAIKWLRRTEPLGGDSPFFMWVHYFDAHAPYTPPASLKSRFANSPYDGEIASVGIQLKRIVDELDRRRIRERTLIVIVADHGEGLGDHDESTHGMLVYGSTMQVGFILSCPGLFKQPQRVSDRVVSLVDLRPTVEDLLGLPITLPADGTSLLASDSRPDRAVYMETEVPFNSAQCSPLFAVRRHGDKYILGSQREYYDLTADPGEQNDLYGTDAPEAETLEAQLEEWLAEWEAAAGGDTGRRSMTQAEIARLGALGYVRAATGRDVEELPDPRSMVQASVRIGEALALKKKGQLAEAQRLLEDVVRQCPTFSHASCVLANLYLERDMPGRAVDLLTESLELKPDFQAAILLAKIRANLREFEAMEEALSVARELRPDHGAVNLVRGRALLQQGRVGAALAEFEEAVRLDPNRAGVVAQLRIKELKEAARKRGTANSPEH